MKEDNLLKNMKDLEDQNNTPIHTTLPDGVFYSNSVNGGKIIKINSNKYKIIESGFYTGIIICGLVVYFISILIFYFIYKPLCFIFLIFCICQESIFICIHRFYYLILEPYSIKIVKKRMFCFWSTTIYNINDIKDVCIDNYSKENSEESYTYYNGFFINLKSNERKKMFAFENSYKSEEFKILKSFADIINEHIKANSV